MSDYVEEQIVRHEWTDNVDNISYGQILVRCKDCIHRGDKHKCILAFITDKQDFPFFFYDNHGEWFCADGKRKDI